MTDEHRREQALSSQQLGTAFRRLADEFALEGSTSNDETWAKIEARSGAAPNLRVAQPSSPARRSPALCGAACAAAAACAVGIWGLSASGFWQDEGGGHAPFSLTYSVHGAVTTAAQMDDEGELIASEGEPVVVQFSDETRVTLDPYSTLRLDSDDKGRSMMARLSQGSAEFEAGPEGQVDPSGPAELSGRSKVTGQPRVTLKAGVYTLRPLGATFSFGYTPREERLDVTSRRGVIVVRDERGHEHRVESGATLKLPEGARDGAPAMGAERGEASPTGVPRGQDASVARAKDGPQGDATPKSFKELAIAGKFAEVVALAKERGISQVLQQASAAELHELGQAARYAGDLPLAEQTWTHMTTRFSGPSAQSARFFLGRLAEQQGNTKKALSHYDAYLKGPGVYTAEALGRKLSIVQQSQGAQKARPIAQDYLRRFPKGSYAQSARELAGGE